MKTSFSKQDTNIVKGLAIIFLMIHHCFLSPSRYKHLEVVFTPLTESQAGYIAAFLKICVGMFVFLTAYGITASLKNKYGTLHIDFKQFASYTAHRLKNLYTGWIFVFLLCEVFCMIYSGLPVKTYGADLQGIIYFLLDGLGLADLFGTPTLVSTWWYMSLAITLVFVMPLVIRIYETIGFVYMAGLFVILVRQLHLTDASLMHWMPAVLLGVVCADRNILGTMRDAWWIKPSMQDGAPVSIGKRAVANKLVKLCFGLFVLVTMVKFRQSGISGILFEIKDGVIPFFVIYLCYEFLCGIPYVNAVLEFIGKYSMNIFLIHTLIRATYFRKFIYGFRYAPLIVLVLLVISLLVAMAVELLKKYSGYTRLVAAVSCRIARRWEQP